MNKGLLYFYADWCTFCPQMSSTLEQIKQQLPINKINIDYDQSTVEKYSVGSVPTVILIENGNEVKRFTGNKSFNGVIDWLNG